MARGPVFLPNELDQRIDACHDAYMRATWRTDLTEADDFWAELQELRAERDAFYALHHRSR